MNLDNFVARWKAYQESRKGTYEFRSRTRYKAVYDRLILLGLTNGDCIIDVGAGSCQFHRFLQDHRFRGSYIPVDAALDGTDLET